MKSVRVNVHTSNTSQAYLIEVAGLPDASKVRVSTFCGAYSRSIRKGTKPVEAGTEVLNTRKFWVAHLYQVMRLLAYHVAGEHRQHRLYRPPFRDQHVETRMRA